MVGRGAMCGACSGERSQVALRLVRGQLHPGARAAAGDVTLVREFKGPRVDQLLSAAPEVTDRLPGVVRSMHGSIAAGDLRAAEAQVDRVAGMLLPGPGARRRVFAGITGGVWPWLWLLVVVALVLWAAW